MPLLCFSFIFILFCFGSFIGSWVSMLRMLFVSVLPSSLGWGFSKYFILFLVGFILVVNICGVLPFGLRVSRQM